MRRWLFLTLLTGFPLNANASDLEDQIRVCRLKAVPTERLECLDKIPLPIRPTVVSPVGSWSIEETKSPLDDSPSVTASLSTRTPDEMLLVIRCRESRTEMFVAANNLIDLNRSLMVDYRIGQLPAVRVEWGMSTTGKAVFAPRDRVISLIRSLPSEGTFYSGRPDAWASTKRCSTPTDRQRSGKGVCGMQVARGDAEAINRNAC